MGARQPVLLFDGDCGLCSRIVQLVFRADRKGTLRFAPLEGEFARGVRERHPRLAGIDSIAWVDWDHADTEQVVVRSEAMLRLAGYLGGTWRLLAVGRVVPKPLRDWLYDWVARRRRRWFQDAACQLPTSAQRERMVG